MLWFLRNFKVFRALEDRCDDLAAVVRESQRRLEAIEHDEVELVNTRRTVVELQHENERLQDRLDALTEDRTQLWTSFQESLRSERAAYQLGINSAIQRMGGGIPYPEAPHLASTQTTGEQVPLGRQRNRMSEVVDCVTDEYIDRKIKEMSN